MSSSADLGVNERQRARAIEWNGLATVLPAGECDGEDEVVMLGAAAPTEKLGAEGAGDVSGNGDVQHFFSRRTRRFATRSCRGTW